MKWMQKKNRQLSNCNLFSYCFFFISNKLRIIQLLHYRQDQFFSRFLEFDVSLLQEVYSNIFIVKCYFFRFSTTCISTSYLCVTSYVYFLISNDNQLHPQSFFLFQNLSFLNELHFEVIRIPLKTKIPSFLLMYSLYIHLLLFYTLQSNYINYF